MFWRKRTTTAGATSGTTGPVAADGVRRAPADEVRPAGRFLIPRTHGMASGLTILVLGAWGGIVAFIGPYFHYAFINHHTWHWTMGRLWLEVIPAAVAVIAGLELIRTANRASGAFAGWLAAAAGTWFIVGQTVSTLWNHGASQAGRPLGSTFLRMIEQLGYFYALGAAILFLAALALGRFTRAAVPGTLAAAPRTPAEPVRPIADEPEATAGRGRVPVAR
jgi:hypothetical protein